MYVCIDIYVCMDDIVFVFHAPSRCAHDLNTTTTTPGENFVQVAWIFSTKIKKENQLDLYVCVCLCEQNNKFVECVPSTDLIFHFLVFSFFFFRSTQYKQNADAFVNRDRDRDRKVRQVKMLLLRRIFKI